MSKASITATIIKGDITLRVDYNAEHPHLHAFPTNDVGRGGDGELHGELVQWLLDKIPVTDDEEFSKCMVMAINPMGGDMSGSIKEAFGPGCGHGG